MFAGVEDIDGSRSLLTETEDRVDEELKVTQWITTKYVAALQLTVELEDYVHKVIDSVPQER